MGEVLIVREDRLGDCPRKFADYVMEYGVRCTIFGIECLQFERHAISPVTGPYHKWRRGSAPSHSVDLMPYEKGNGGVNINEWLHKNRGRGIFESFYTTERSGGYIDD